MPAADKRETELMSDARYRFTITVGSEDAGSRLDSWLASVDDPDMREKLVSRSAIQKVIAEGNVLVNGSTAKKNMVLKAGDVIDMEVPELKTLEAVPQDVPIDIVYEDTDVIVVNKPQGMVVHPAPGNPDGTYKRGYKTRHSSQDRQGYERTARDLQERRRPQRPRGTVCRTLDNQGLLCGGKRRHQR